MNSPAPDPLDLVWSPADREEIRTQYHRRATEAADATIAIVRPEHLDAFKPEVYRASVIAEWLAVWDSRIARAAEIMRAPEAVGREHLARHLVVDTQHSAAAAIVILRGAGSDIGVLPSGDARIQRVAAMRRSATMGAL